MKALLLSLCISLGVAPATWLTDFSQAKNEAAQAKKAILLNFSGSDWCGPCIMMKKQVFESEPFQAYANDHLVLVRADFPRQKKNQLTPAQTQHNESLAERFNPEGKFPFTVLITPEGTVLKKWDGYAKQSPAEFIADLDAVTHANH